MRGRLRGVGLAALVALALTGCEGSGNAGDGLVIRNDPTANCTKVAGEFPPGLALLSKTTALAAVVQYTPAGVAVYRLDGERPILIRSQNIGNIAGKPIGDTDGDDEIDKDASVFLFPPPYNGETAKAGEIRALRDDLALLSTSGYEQVLVYDPSTASPLTVNVEVPIDVPPGRYPLLPAPGTSAPRTGISTFACMTSDLFPDSFDGLDSSGLAIDPDPRCDLSAPSFLTAFTAGKAVAAGRLFVATSNFLTAPRYQPGTLLVYGWVDMGSGIRVSPSVETPVLFTSGFNPTGLARHVTASGKEVVLATVSGALGSIHGVHSALTEAAVDVIDPSVPRIAATIPLGFAGPSFEPAAIDPSGQIAWLGSAVHRELYAIDLRALDDPRLYAYDDVDDPPLILDGKSVGFPDARVFTADYPLGIPGRTDRPSSFVCPGYTYVTLNEAGTEAFASDYCDGTLTRVRLDLSGMPPIPFPRARFQVAGQSAPFAPNTAQGEAQFPSVIATRPGRPGIDYTSPDVFVLVGLPDAQLCGLRVESF